MQRDAPAPTGSDRDRTLDLRVLMLIVGIVATLLALAALVAAVRGGGSQALDEELLTALRRADAPGVLRGPAWLPGAARDITALGSTTVLVLLVAAVVFYLLVIGRVRLALLVLVAGLGARELSTGLKHVIGRDRPQVVPYLIEGLSSASFPSGHALGSAAVFLTLAALLTRIQRRRRAKLYVLAVGVTATLLVGTSRVLLGVHYPSDVLAGWLIGALWALLCDAVVAMLQRRGAVSR